MKEKKKEEKKTIRNEGEEADGLFGRGGAVDGVPLPFKPIHVLRFCQHWERCCLQGWASM